jgi:phosphatidylinositol glycan class K
MLADDMACNPRNIYPGQIFNNENKKLNLYGENIEVDYRGYEVTVTNFTRLLTGRHAPDVSRSKRLLTDSRSNILIFLTGHGGDEFLKFQDAEEISSYDIADSFAQMWEKHRYNEILFMVDTCQANTLFKRFYSPNIIAIGSSKLGENSYSHHSDGEIGVAVIDRFTYYTLEFFENTQDPSAASIQQLFLSYNPQKLNSQPEYRVVSFSRDLSTVPLTDFFGSVMRADVTPIVDYYKSITCSESEVVRPQEPVHIDIEHRKKRADIEYHIEQLVNHEFITTGLIFSTVLLVLAKLT